MAEGKTTMGLLVAFGVGFLIGAQGGREGFDDVVTAAREVRNSEEFADLVMAARGHISESLQELGRRINGDAREPQSIVTLLEMARGRSKEERTEP
jgi:hypothetical protein